MYFKQKNVFSKLIDRHRSDCCSLMFRCIVVKVQHYVTHWWHANRILEFKMQRCNLTVSLRGDQAVSGHPPPHIVSEPSPSARHQCPVYWGRNKAAVLPGAASVYVNGLASYEQTCMRSLLLPCHASTRNWDNECWETLEQCNFTRD